MLVLSLSTRLLLTTSPGEAYFYGPSHMQILASIAQAVTGEPWAQLYTDRLAQPLGMEATLYDWPSESNPGLSTGAVSTVQDFQRFAQSMLINSHWPTTWDEMVTDHTPKESVTMAYSPLSDSTRGWHYGLGVWLECPNPNWEESCNTVGVISRLWHVWISSLGRYGSEALRCLGHGGSIQRLAEVSAAFNGFTRGCGRGRFIRLIVRSGLTLPCVRSISGFELVDAEGV